MFWQIKLNISAIISRERQVSATIFVAKNVDVKFQFRSLLSVDCSFQYFTTFREFQESLRLPSECLIREQLYEFPGGNQVDG